MGCESGIRRKTRQRRMHEEDCVGLWGRLENEPRRQMLSLFFFFFFAFLQPKQPQTTNKQATHKSNQTMRKGMSLHLQQRSKQARRLQPQACLPCASRRISRTSSRASSSTRRAPAIDSSCRSAESAQSSAPGRFACTARKAGSSSSGVK